MNKKLSYHLENRESCGAFVSSYCYSWAFDFLTLVIRVGFIKQKYTGTDACESTKIASTV